MQLQQRCWLIHWSLFLFFNPSQLSAATYGGVIDFLFLAESKHKKDGGVEYVYHDKVINTIQTACPHILRYIVVAVICSMGGTTNRRPLLEELVNILLTESWRDPVTNFLLSLYHDFDMEAAHSHLRDCEALFDSDYFLSALGVDGSNRKEDFMENGRRLLFEIYCKTHERLDMDLLASRLGCASSDSKEGETESEVMNSILRYVREAGLRAKVDSKKNQLIMERDPPSVYQTVIDRTKGLSYKTSMMTATLEKQQYQG
jgi:translation initiation factor 3 subunit E